MKQHVILLCGGKSGEHEVSVNSARSVEKALDRDRFTSSCIGITKQGYWHYGETVAEITQGNSVLPPNSTVVLPDGSSSTSLAITTASSVTPLSDAILFPLVHGTNGEDGTLQGLLELANIPYVGSGVLGSAVSMDKITQKKLCAMAELPQTIYSAVTGFEFDTQAKRILGELEKKHTFPLFVKPANLGSSVGVSKVKTPSELATAIETALQYDLTCIVENAVSDMIEVEVAVLGNHTPQASVCGSIQPNTEFYDYETKYITDDIQAAIPAAIPEAAAEAIRACALQAFTTLNCSGMARVDFFYQPQSDRFYLNEVNTIPGFTATSMYPKLWEASGVSFTELISRLIQLASERWQEKQELSYEYTT